MRVGWKDNSTRSVEVIGRVTHDEYVPRSMFLGRKAAKLMTNSAFSDSATAVPFARSAVL